MTRDDFRRSCDFALATFGVFGVLMAALAVVLLCLQIGGVLFAAANGAN